MDRCSGRAARECLEVSRNNNTVFYHKPPPWPYSKYQQQLKLRVRSRRRAGPFSYILWRRILLNVSPTKPQQVTEFQIAVFNRPIQLLPPFCKPIFIIAFARRRDYVVSSHHPSSLYVPLSLFATTSSDQIKCNEIKCRNKSRRGAMLMQRNDKGETHIIQFNYARCFQ